MLPSGMKVAADSTESNIQKANDRSRAEAGSATLELAITLPVVLLLLAGMLTGAAAIQVRLQVSDAARVAARQLALGTDEHAVTVIVHQIVGGDAQVTFMRGGSGVTVTVSAPVMAFTELIMVSSSFTVPWEPGVP